MMAWVPSVRSALRRMPRGPDVDVVLAFVAFAALLVDPLASHQVTELTPLDGGLALVTAVPLVLAAVPARRARRRGAAAVRVPGRGPPDRAAAGIAMLLVFTVGLSGTGPVPGRGCADGTRRDRRRLSPPASWRRVAPRRSPTWPWCSARWSPARPCAPARRSSGSWPRRRPATRGRRSTASTPSGCAGARAARRRRAHAGGHQRTGRGRRAPGAPGTGSQRSPRSTR